ncbi:acetyltransferase (GNAT) family protein [Murinocardiopsis flavida]|uniref:Acetyltransferase (GNAT) family protein n=1 Tax=Murinocardiopsis flavida TaxID=645275 RepID=A0A2P8CNK5_9ACTN|nr:GNAT family N-acetyltransferase [Murinocardiopsis flavida]PSK86524.1 acetyltransferase (GNAT) family protein [Murinocardiopsis flavida]
MPEPGFRIETAVPGDVGEIWTVQLAAYVTEAQAYGDPFILPLTENATQIGAALDRGVLLLKAVEGTRIVGSVRGTAQGGTFLVNRLTVAPDRRRKGIARALMTALEERARAEYPEVATFALFTGHMSDGNLRLYRSLGYHEVSRDRSQDHVTMVHLRKAAAHRQTADQ